MTSGRVVITGGCGYVGFRLGCHIAQHFPDLGPVVLFDVAQPRYPLLPDGVDYVHGDIRSAEAVNRAIKGATLVIHVASYGMSGVEALDRQKIRDINVTGTKNVIEACQQVGDAAGVRLIYVSTYNAVFDGRKPVVDGDEESYTYVNPRRCNDTYSLTKAEAERAVLAANGTALPGQIPYGAGGGTLHTCSVRPGAIWGPGEQRHMLRILRLVKGGWVLFVFGDEESKVDFVHVDNLINGLLLAAQGLTAEKACVAGGKAYFINDEQPVNNFEHFRRLIEGLGYRWPHARLPYVFVYMVAAWMEDLARLLMAVTKLQVAPLLSRAEVIKCAVTHTAKCARARADLGYAPSARPELHNEAVAWYAAKGWSVKRISDEELAKKGGEELAANHGSYHDDRAVWVMAFTAAQTRTCRSSTGIVGYVCFSHSAAD
mmetsp:Transcript_9400/g.16634  ORF Transcript_9400/g.16634 Transcript_9400/m.16634 type:complete len:430 (-) Transcript_9400:448-1737(-)